MDTFSEDRFWHKLGRFASTIGLKAVYTALLLYYAYKKKETPKWAKRVVVGALVYLIVPVDAIPDFIPLLGFTDDLGILTSGLLTIAAYIDDDVRRKARQKLDAWFPVVTETDIDEIDDRLT